MIIAGSLPYQVLSLFVFSEMQIGNIVWFIIGKTLRAPLYTKKTLKNKLTSNLPPKISRLKS